MRIGYVYNPGSLTPGSPYSAIVEDIREKARFCDENGFDSFWLSEHHFGMWDRTPLPNPIMMAADIAARTKRLRIGFASVIIPFWNPIRLAEDVALLDHFSGGRVEFGVGRGNYPVEAMNLNPMADPRDQAGNYKVFEETLEIIKRAFTEKYFSFSGEKYVYPAPRSTWDRTIAYDPSEFMNPETKEFTKLALMPRPVQQPHPPLWQVVDSSRSIEFAARNGLKFIMWRPTARRLAEHYQTYLQAARDAGIEKTAAAGPSILRDTFVTETMQEARDIGGPHVMKSLNFSNWRGPHIYTEPGEVLAPELEAALKRELPYDWVHPRSLLFGTPDYIIEKLNELREVANVELLLLSFDWGGRDSDFVKRSVRMFTEKVLPQAAAI